jgi:tetratricopeptide (TPR) repeat protein
MKMHRGLVGLVGIVLFCAGVRADTTVAADETHAEMSEIEFITLLALAGHGWVAIEQMICNSPAPRREAIEVYCSGASKQDAGDHEGAIRDLVHALELEPGLYFANFWLGLAYYDNRDYLNSVAAFDQYLTVAPWDYMVLSNRAGAYAAMGNITAAREDIDRALELGSNDVILLENRIEFARAGNDDATVISDASWLIEHHPAKVKWLLRRGNALLHQSRLDEALADSQRATELEPSRDTFFLRGVIQYHQKAYAPAIEDFTRTLTFDPEYAPAYRHLCLSYYGLQAFAIGLTNCDEFVRRAPQVYEGYYERGILRSRVGDQAGAIADYRRAIELARDESRASNAWYGVGIASERSGKMKDARDAYRRALAANPENQQAQQALARLRR